MRVFVYKSFTRDLFERLRLVNEDVRCLLMESVYDPSWGHLKRADIIHREIVGRGYETNGKPLLNKRVFQNFNGEAALTADPLEWTSATIKARGAALYHAATENLICYFDFGKEQSSFEGTFRLKWDVLGIVSIGQAT